MGKRKEKDDTHLRKKNKRKTEQCYYKDICSWKRDSFSSEVEKKKGNHLNKDIKEKSFEKDLTNLTETNYQIIVTSEHFISSNK